MAAIQSFRSGGERAGLALIAASGLSSALSTISLLTYIVWNAYFTKDRSSPLHRGIRSLVQSSLGCYLLSLLVCDFLQGVAFSMNFKWSAIGEMKVGTTCTVQGAVSEVGDLGAAIWSLAISLHTFSLLFFVHKPHRFIAPAVLFIGWTLLIVLPILGPTVLETKHKGPFYGLSGAWCWLSNPYGTERLIYLYIWVFAALGSSAVIYSLIYLRFANIIALKENGGFQFQWPSKAKMTGVNNAKTQPTRHVSRRLSFGVSGCFDWGSDTRDGTTSSTTGNSSDPTFAGPITVSSRLKQIARRLMWYPILYAIVVLPVSICRMGVLAGWTPPFGLFLFAGICFAGSGVTNSILFIITRHSYLKKVTQPATRVHVTTQRITIREEVGVDGKDVELAPMRSPTTASAKSPYFIDSPFTANLDTMGRSYASSVGSDGDDVDQKGGIYVSVIE